MLYKERTSQDYASGIGLDIGHKKTSKNTSKSGKDGQEPKSCKWCKQTTHQTKRPKKCPFNAKKTAAQEQAYEEQKSSKRSDSEETLLCRPCNSLIAEENSEEKNEARSASDSTTEVVRDVVNIRTKVFCFL